MSKAEKAALNRDAAEFVRKVVTEVYGQKMSKRAVSAAARQVVAALPWTEVHAVRTDGSRSADTKKPSR